MTKLDPVWSVVALCDLLLRVKSQLPDVVQTQAYEQLTQVTVDCFNPADPDARAGLVVQIVNKLVRAGGRTNACR